MTAVALPCPSGGLPTKADLTNMFNQITAIPSDIEAEIAKIKQNASQQTADLQDRITELENEMSQKAGEERARVQAQIDELKNSPDPFGIISEIEDTVKDIEETIETVSDLFSPWWQKGNIRQLEKEAEDAFTELTQEFHIFIPAKMMEMISKIIPVEFTVPVLGLSIDVLKIADGDYQAELKAQIAGTSEEYTTKLKTLQEDFKSGKLEQDAYDSALGMLEDEKAAIIDKFYALVPEQYRYFDGEFGVECAEWKAKLTWSYIKNEIMEWVTNSLFKLFDTLIGKFKEIWDALGLPDLPIPLSFDVAEWVRAGIDAVIAKKDKEIQRIRDDITQLESDVKNFDAKKELEDQLDSIQNDIITEIGELSIPLPSPFNISINDMMGGEIEGKVQCLEDKIHQMVTAARDWKTISMKELFNIWLRKIKKFLSAIGLGKLLDFLDLSFCDVLELIGLPLEIEIPLPDLENLAGGLRIEPPLLIAVGRVPHRAGGLALPSLDDIQAPDTENMTEEEFQEFIDGLV